MGIVDDDIFNYVEVILVGDTMASGITILVFLIDLLLRYVLAALFIDTIMVIAVFRSAYHIQRSDNLIGQSDNEFVTI